MQADMKALATNSWLTAFLQTLGSSVDERGNVAVSDDLVSSNWLRIQKCFRLHLLLSPTS